MSTVNPVVETRRKMYEFLTGDFRALWEVVSNIGADEVSNRGNYVFATILFQLADLGKFVDIGSQLEQIDPAYGDLLAHWDRLCETPRSVPGYEEFDRGEYAYNNPIPARRLGDETRNPKHLKKLEDGAILVDCKTMFLDLTGIIGPAIEAEN